MYGPIKMEDSQEIFRQQEEQESSDDSDNEGSLPDQFDDDMQDSSFATSGNDSSTYETGGGRHKKSTRSKTSKRHSKKSSSSSSADEIDRCVIMPKGKTVYKIFDDIQNGTGGDDIPFTAHVDPGNHTVEAFDRNNRRVYSSEYSRIFYGYGGGRCYKQQNTLLVEERGGDLRYCLIECNAVATFRAVAPITKFEVGSRDGEIKMFVAQDQKKNWYALGMNYTRPIMITPNQANKKYFTMYDKEEGFYGGIHNTFTWDICQTNFAGIHRYKTRDGVHNYPFDYNHDTRKSIPNAWVLMNNEKIYGIGIKEHVAIQKGFMKKFGISFIPQWVRKSKAQ